MNLLQIFEKPWALQQESFEFLVKTFSNDNFKNNVFEKMKMFNESIPAADGNKLKNENGIAIIKINGIITQGMDFFSFLFGGADINLVSKQFRDALQDDQISAIIFDINSPGGDVSGTPELSELIYKNRGIKPIIAYAAFDCSSAAYWIASACDAIIMQEAARVGSIGVMATFFREATNEKEEEINIISSVSPKKYIDINTNEGIMSLQRIVDEMGEVFVKNVAKYRSVSIDVVLNNFGQGDIVIAEQAIPRGMADGMGIIDDAVFLTKAISENINKNEVTKMNFLGKNKTIIQQKGVAKLLSQGEETVNPDEITLEWLQKNKPELIEELQQNSDEEEAQGINVDEITLEWLQKNKPELIEELQNSATKKENARIAAIEDQADLLADFSPDVVEFLKSAKFEKSLSAADTLQEILNFQAEKRKEIQAGRHEDAAAIPAIASNPDSSKSDSMTIEQRKEAYRAGIKKLRGK